MSSAPDHEPSVASRLSRPGRVVGAREVTLVVFVMGFLVSVGVGVILSSAEAAVATLVVTGVVCAGVFAVITSTRSRRAP